MSRTVFCGSYGPFRRLKSSCAVGSLVSLSRTCTTAKQTTETKTDTKTKTETTANSGSAGEARENAMHFTIDPKLLPNTIPGVSQEELAARIEKYEQEMSYKAARASERALVNEIDNMRRAMPPDQFQKFLKELDEMQVKNAKEAARLDAMSPQQLYRYQQRQRLKLRVQEILKTVWILVVIFGTVFYIFFFFLFFH